MVETGILYLGLVTYSMLICKFIEKFKFKYKNRNIDKLVYTIDFILLMGPIIFVYGMREDVGVDYPTYYSYFRYFRGVINSWSDIFHQNFEPGYVLLNKFSFEYLNEYVGVFVATGIIIFGLLYIAMLQYKGEIDLPMFFLIYFSVFFGASCNIVRQTIAMLIVLVGYRYVLEKKYIMYILICFVAFLFHKSAMVCVLIVMFDKFYLLIKDKIKTFIIGVSLFIVFFGEVIVSKLHMLSIFKITYNRGGFNSRAFLFLLYLIPEILFIEYFKKRLGDECEKIEQYISMFYLQLPLQLLDIYSSALQRIAIYFSVLQIIVVPSILRSMRTKKDYWAWRLAVISWYVLYFIMTEIVMVGNKLFPYQMYKLK